MNSDSDFHGGVFHDSIEGRRAPGRIELRPHALAIVTEKHGEFSLDYGECLVELGGASGKMVFCHNKDRSIVMYTEDREFPAALKRAGYGTMSEKVEQMQRESRQRGRRSNALVLTVLALMAALVVGGYFGIRYGAAAAVQAMPPSVDRKIGALAYKSMDLEGPELTEGPAVEAIEKIVERLAAHVEQDGFHFDVHVIDAPVENAFALPGGQIVVYTGLIDTAKSPEQVAGVVAHEMAHVIHRHGIQAVSRSIGVSVAIDLMLGDASEFVRAGADVLESSAVNSYSREQEAEADATGVKLLHDAGIDPMGLATFFQTMHQTHGDLPSIASWMSTHPQHEDRIEAVSRQVARLPKKEYQPLEVDWEKVKKRLR